MTVLEIVVPTPQGNYDDKTGTSTPVTYCSTGTKQKFYIFFSIIWGLRKIKFKVRTQIWTHRCMVYYPSIFSLIMNRVVNSYPKLKIVMIEKSILIIKSAIKDGLSLEKAKLYS